MLLVDARKRSSSETVRHYMQELEKKCRTDQDYAVKGVPMISRRKSFTESITGRMKTASDRISKPSSNMSLPRTPSKFPGREQPERLFDTSLRQDLRRLALHNSSKTKRQTPVSLVQYYVVLNKRGELICRLATFGMLYRTCSRLTNYCRHARCLL
jgi:hypothetical protein